MSAQPFDREALWALFAGRCVMRAWRYLMDEEPRG